MPTTRSEPMMRTQIVVNATGEPFGLRVEGETISFCDTRGGRKVDPATGNDLPFKRACAKDREPNTSCGGFPLDVTVSTPNLGPNDLVEVKGRAFPLAGRVHDCAASGKALGIVTGSEVVLIDTTVEKASVLEHEGGDRVAIGADWIAWSNGPSVYARRR
jgi:hypothetical protein